MMGKSLRVSGGAALAAALAFFLPASLCAAPVDLAISTPSYPADTGYINYQPNFAWAGPSTTTVAALGAGSWYALEVSSDDPAFAAGNVRIRVSRPAAVVSTSVFTVDAVYTSTFTLTPGATYYWRVKTVDGVSLNSGPWSSVSSFNMDLSSPALNGFRVASSTGGLMSETQWVALLSGTTAQAVAYDALSGLKNAVNAFGLRYSTTSGADWNRDPVTLDFDSASHFGVNSIAFYNDKLFAGLRGNTHANDIYFYDGSSWQYSYNGSNNQGIYAMAVYDGKLYAGEGNDPDACQVLVFDGISWGVSGSFGSGAVRSFAVYNGKLYAGMSLNGNTDGDIYVFDGQKWSMAYDGAQEGIYALAVYNGKLYAGQGNSTGDGDVLVYDGSSWAVSYNGAQEYIHSLEVFNGRLYAGQGSGTGDGDVLVFDGSAWSQAFNGSQESIYDLHVHNGRLYAAQGGNTAGDAAVYSYNGASWALELSTTSDGVGALGSYGGSWFAGMTASGATTQGDIVQARPGIVPALSGADGSLGYETISSTGLVFAQSANSNTCGGIAPCSATNQVVFNVSDRAGNVAAYGPYAVLNDRYRGSGLIISTPSYPANGANIKHRRPAFTWVGVSTGVAANIGAGAQYEVDYSLSQDLSGAVTLSTPVVLGSTLAFTADGLVEPSVDLAGGTTYYWRVRLKTPAGHYPPAWSTYTFVTDFTPPSASGYRVLSSTGGLLSESQMVTLASGATVQISLQDSGPAGLDISGSSAAVRPSYSMLISSVPGAAYWQSGTFDFSNGGASIGPAPSSAESYAGNLYVGLNDGRVAVFDGSAWGMSNSNLQIFSGAPRVAAMREYRGKLYAVSYTGKMAVFDGASWTVLPFEMPAYQAQKQMSVYNDKLYVFGFTGSSVTVAAFDGVNWAVRDSELVVSYGPSIASMWQPVVYNGRLYLSTIRWPSIETLVYDGASWRQITGAGTTEYNGKLYSVMASTIQVYDGSTWQSYLGQIPWDYNYQSRTVQYGGRLFVHNRLNGGDHALYSTDYTFTYKTLDNMGPDTVNLFQPHADKLYMILSDGRVRVYTPFAASLSGQDGATSSQVLVSSSSFNLAHSTNSVTCGGVGPCSAVNKVLFTGSDRAGNVAVAGPYAILNDKFVNSPLLVSTPAWPVGGSFVNTAKPGFSWVGVSTGVAAQLGSGGTYVLEVDNDADFSSPEVLLSTPVILASTMNFTADGFIKLSTHTLAQNSWHRYRLRVRTGLGNFGLFLTTNTFFVDITSPTAHSFRVKDEAGTPVLESQFIKLSAGVTVQMQVQDIHSGLAVSTSSLWGGGDGHDWSDRVSGYGVKYTNDAGATWREHSSWNEMNGGAAVLPGTVEVFSMAVYNGKLYAGTSIGKVAIFDGTSWTPANGDNPLSGSVLVNALGVYKGKLYAGTSNAKVAVFDGVDWTLFNSGNAILPGGTNIKAMSVYNDKLYVAVYPGARMAVYDGNTWSEANGGNPIVPGADYIYSMAVYNGRLYAGTSPDGKVGVYDGVNWATANNGVKVVSDATAVTSLLTYNGKLYAGTFPSGKVAVYDDNYWDVSNSSAIIVASSGRTDALSMYGGKLYMGTGAIGKAGVFDGSSWYTANSGNALAAGSTYVRSLSAFNGKLYAGTSPDGKVAEMVPVNASLSGTDGTGGNELLAGLVNFSQSTSAATCGGVAACGATNQVIFNITDRAGNVRVYGPFAVLVDHLAYSTLAVATPTWPADGSYLGIQKPVFSWIGVSTTVAAALGPNARYRLEVDDNADFSSPEIAFSTPVVLASTMDFTSDGSIRITTHTLADSTLYNWRVRVLTALGNYAPHLATSTFTTDFSSPSAAGYGVYSSTGGLMSEAALLALPTGATAQITVQDTGSGLNVSAAGFGVVGSTDSGRYAIDGAWTVANSGNPILAGQNTVSAFGLYGGNLYAAINSRVAVFNGAAWNDANGGSSLPAAVYAFTAYKGKLYGVCWGGTVVVFDGASWIPANGGNPVIQGELSIISLAVYNDKLYAGTSSNAKVVVFDGSSWSVSNGGKTLSAGEAYVHSLAVYNGRLYAGTGYGGKVLVYNGASWEDMGQVITGVSSIHSLAVYNNKLYAGGVGGKVASYNGTSWTMENGGNAVVAGGNRVTSLQTFGGRLYAGVTDAKMAVYDGRRWSEANSGKSIMPGGAYVNALAVYGDRLYAGVDTFGKIAELQAFPSGLLAAAGQTTPALLTSSGVVVAQSTSAAVCGGAACGATNQFTFNITDRAGNVRAAGPYTVLNDFATASTAVIPVSPASGGYARTLRPEIFWGGPSTTTAVVLGVSTSTRFDIQVSLNDPAFGSTLYDFGLSTISFSTNSLRVAGSYKFISDLSDNSTYYWRVRLRNHHFNSTGPWTTAQSFVTDTLSPVVSGFRVMSSTGGWLSETQGHPFAAGTTVQLLVQDAAPGSGLGLGGRLQPDAGTVGLWHFSERDGQTVLDHSATASHGTLGCIGVDCGTATYSGTPLGAGLGLNGPLGSMMTAPNTAFNFPVNSNFTIEAWIRPDTLSGAQQIAGVGGSSVGGNYGFKLVGNGFGFANNSGSCANVLVPELQAGVWQFVVMTVRGNRIEYYLNGRPAGAASCTIGAGVGNSGFFSKPFAIGAGTRGDGLYDNPFRGAIDEVRVLNYAALPEQIASDYSASAPGDMSVQYSTNAGVSWLAVSATSAAGGYMQLTHDGALGSNASVTLAANGLNFAVSTNGVVCAGVSPCGATNQVKFSVSDKAGNFVTAGPYSVINDPLSQSVTVQLLAPAGGAYTGTLRPRLVWAGPSTATARAIGVDAAPRYDLQVSFNDPDFTGTVVDTLVTMPPASSTAPFAPGYYDFGFSLDDGATYYWRARFRNQHSGITGQWSTSSFVTDGAVPGFSGFRVLSSTGGWLSEGQWINLQPGSTLQAQLQDAVSGLRVSPSPTGYSVMYSTNAGLSWITEGMSLSYSGTQERMYSLAVYNGKLYAGQGQHGGDGDIYVYDGNSWLLSYDGSQEEIPALYVYKGKLYAGQGSGSGDGDVLVFDGFSWTVSYNGPHTRIKAFAEYNGNLYVGTQGGSGDVLVFDGVTWRVAYDDWPPGIGSMAVYNGRLYAGVAGGSGEGDVLAFDGNTWTQSYDGTYDAVNSMAVYNGKLYAGMGNTVSEGNVLVFDGSAWNMSYDGPQEIISSLFEYNGKLYAGQGADINDGDLLVFDGASWRDVYAGDTNYIYALAAYNGALYAGQGNSTNDGDVLKFTPLASASVSGANGSTGLEVFLSTRLAFAPSQTGATCGGAPCGATNQVIFNAADRAGNVARYGPYAVLVDAAQGLPAPEPGFPQGPVNTLRPNFAWVGLSSGVAAQLPVNSYYSLQVSADPGFGSFAVNMTTPVVVSSLNFTSDGAYAPASDLTPATTYYWRVQVCNFASANCSAWGGPAVFYTDNAKPVFSGFQIQNSTGGWLAADSWVNTPALPAIRVGVTDAESGLAVSTGVLPFSGEGRSYMEFTKGWSVDYSSNAGTSWSQFLSTAAYDTAETYIRAFAVFNGKLYAGTANSGQIYSSADGVNWNLVYDSAASNVFSMAVYKGYLYAFTGGAGFIYRTADGSSWSLVATVPEGNLQTSKVFNGKLYVGTSVTGRVYVTDNGVNWSMAGDTDQTYIYSMAVHNGRLYAGGGPPVGAGTLYSSPNGRDWAPVYTLPTSFIHALVSFNGALFLGTAGGCTYSSQDGVSFTAGPCLGGGIYGMMAYGGKLYAGTSDLGLVYSSVDGLSWKKEIAPADVYTHGMATFDGKWYAGTQDDGTIFQVSPLNTSLSGTDGTKEQQTLGLQGLALAPSANANTCNGGTSCFATNQVRVAAADLAGNVRYAYYSVMVDTIPPPATAIQSYQAYLSSVSLLSSSVIDLQSGTRDYNFEISEYDDFSVLLASSGYTTQLNWVFSGLQEATTYYLRSAARDQAYNTGVYSAVVPALTYGFVSVSSHSVAPASALQGAEAAMLAVSMAANPGRQAVFQRLNLVRTGTSLASDISAARVYRDNNGDSLIDAGDTLLGSSGFSGVNAAVNITPALTVTDTPVRLLVAYSFASGATVGRTAGVSIPGQANFVFMAPYQAAGALPMSTSLSTIEDGANTLNITPISVAPGAVQPGVGNVAVLRLAMNTNIGTSIISKINVIMGGTAGSTDLSTVKIYRDANGNAQFDMVGDTLLSSGADTFLDYSSTVTLTAAAASRTVGVVPVYLFVVADVAADAAEGSNFTLSIATASAVELVNPADTPSMTPASFVSGQVTVQTNNSATVALQDQVPAKFVQGGLYAVALASVNVNVGIAELNRLKVNRIGTAFDSDVKSVQVYKDQVLDGGGFNRNFDLFLGSAAFASGVATVNITTSVITAGTTSQFFIVYEVSPSASGGATLGAGFTNSTYFRMGSPFTAVSGNFPFNTATAPVEVTVNPLLIHGAVDMTTGDLLQGTTNNAILRLDLRSEFNPVTWTSLRLLKTGTLPDPLVDAVKIYRDADASGTLDAGVDELITSGADVFVAGALNLAFSSPQSVTSAGGSYLVAVDLDPAATPGDTLGISISTTGWLTINSPNYISTASLTAPYSGGPALVKQYPNIVTVSSQSALSGSGAYPGDANVPVLKLNLRTNISTAKFLKLQFSKAGTMLDDEVKAVKLYYDINNIGSFNRSNVGAYSLVSPSTVTFGTDGQPGMVFLPVLAAGQDLNTAGRNYFLAVDVATSAVIGRSMTMRVLDASYVTVDSPPNSVAPVSFVSPQFTVLPPPQTLAVAFESKISTYVIQGQSSVLVASFTATVSSYSLVLSRIDFSRGGNSFDSDVSALKLYADNGNGAWGGISEESLLRTAGFSGGLASFASLSQEVQAGSPKVYYLVADISGTAVYGRTLGVDCSAPGYFQVNDPHSVSGTGFPFSGQRAVIQPTVDTVLADGVNAAPTLRQGDTAKVLGRLRLRTDANSATLTSVRFDKSGTTPDSDITRLRLYRDANGSLSLDGGDELAGTLTAFSGASGVMVVSPSQGLSTSDRDYLVAVDISTFAVVGSSFSFRVVPGVSAPDAVSVNGGTITFSMAGTLSDNPDNLTLTFENLASQSMYLGVADTPLARLLARTDLDSAYFTGVKLDFAGSAGAADIGLVKLYRDTDGSNYFDPAYDVLAATAALAAGEAYIYLPGAGDLVTVSTRVYFAVIDIAAGATIGRTVTAGIANENSIFVGGVDRVAVFPPAATPTGTIRDPRVPTPPGIKVFKADGRVYSSVDEVFNAYRTLLKFRWESTAYQGSVERVYYHIGATPADESTPGSAWVDAGGQDTVYVRGLNLLNNGAYFISVKVKNSLGAYYSDIVSKRFFVDTVVPVISADGVYTTQEAGDLVLNWADAVAGISGVEYYVVEERRGNSPLWVAVSSTTDRFLPIVGGGTAPAAIERQPGSYFYRVYPVNNAGVSGTPSGELAVNIGLERLSVISDASFYPNPFDSRKQGGTVAFTLSRASPVDIIIYDVFGRKVKSIGLAGVVGPNSAGWDGSSSGGGKVSMGMYLCVIKAAGSSKVIKVGVKH